MHEANISAAFEVCNTMNCSYTLSHVYSVTLRQTFEQIKQYPFTGL